MSGCAVEVKRECWVASGGWTWSNPNCCFLLAPEPEAAVGPAVAEPAADGAAVVASTVTTVGDVAWTTERWKRAGMEATSASVVGRIRRAVDAEAVRNGQHQRYLHNIPTCTDVVGAVEDDGGAMTTVN